MNVVVYPNGTAELDHREVDVITEDLFETPPMQVRLMRDQVTEGVALIDNAAEEVNRRARHMVDALVGVHIVFKGIVLLTQLNPQDAVDLLTVE